MARAVTPLAHGDGSGSVRTRPDGLQTSRSTVVAAVFIVLSVLLGVVMTPLVSTADASSGSGGSSGRSPSTVPGQTIPRYAIPMSTKQVIVGVTEGWKSTVATLQRFERTGTGWVAVSAPFPARLGPKGLAWGRGKNPVPDDGRPTKRELDGRAPAGVFRLDTVFGYEAAWAARSKMPFIQVTANDLFIEDPSSELYNRYVRLDHEPATQWERDMQMEQADPAHRLKVLVGHNLDPSPVSGAGSAIFLHLWRRDGKAVTAGCTAMDAAHLEPIVSWLDPAKRPLYVLLPRSFYDAAQTAWGLPPAPRAVPLTQ